MSLLKNNSDFLFGFEAVLTNTNGDPDQENKPRMDYETSTLLVSDARRKRDIRDFLKNKGYRIFVDTLADVKVPMDVMFKNIVEGYLSSKEKLSNLLESNTVLKNKFTELFKGSEDDLLKAYNSDKIKKNKDFIKFNNLFLTEIVKKELIDIRLFGSAMAVENVSVTYTGPVQINWGYSLHPVEIVKSNTITSIMNNDNSTFGKKYKIYYALVMHYGIVNKYSAKLTGMTAEDKSLFRKALVQGMMSNQTDSKQGQNPLFYYEIVYKPEFDGYLGDLRRFVDVKYDENKPIRDIKDLKIDFSRLNSAIESLKQKGYIEKTVGWKHPLAQNMDLPEYEPVDLMEPVEKVED
jgi:CRISPR-associated protein Csh2